MTNAPTTAAAADNKTILLIITGGIAAYKSLLLIRLLRKKGMHVRCIMTKAAHNFVTPMSVSALCEHPVYTDLWSLKDESEMGHIRLSREADLIVIAPATANIIAQLAHGLAQDLASTTLLAADKPVMIAPAMNYKMWEHPAVIANMETLSTRGVLVAPPTRGDMACGEHGVGRMAEPETIAAHINDFFLNKLSAAANKDLSGVRALITAGPTHEPIDPVRFIGNRSSGKQGYAIADALSMRGASVTLISGPVHIAPPRGVDIINVQTAAQMHAATMNAITQNDAPFDTAICTAAVADWGVDNAPSQKMKKRADGAPPHINLRENPDILRDICAHKQRPRLVIGFAAETQNIIEHARAKRIRKNCDWILANDVSENRQSGDDKNKDGARGGVFGADNNHVHLITAKNEHDWGYAPKTKIAQILADHIKNALDDAP